MKTKIAIFSISPRYLPGGYDNNSRINRYISKEISEILSDYPATKTTLLSSLALGPEVLFATFAKDNGYELHSIIPCLGQDDKWYEAERAKYRELILTSDEVINITNTLYTPSSMQEKDQYLLKNSDIFIMISSKKKPIFELLSVEKEIIKMGKTIIYIDIDAFM